MPDFYATSSGHSFMMYDAFRLSGFPKHLLFYEFKEKEILVLRVLHGARRPGKPFVKQ